MSPPSLEEGYSSPSEFGGVFAVIDDEQAAKHVFFGLYAIQHRGQESAGLTVFTPDGQAVTRKGLGLAGEVFKEKDLLELAGTSALGQVRAADGHNSPLLRAQPLAISTGGHPLALALNGRLTNGRVLKKALMAKGAIIQTETDAELLLHLIVGELVNSEFRSWPEKAPTEKAEILSQALARALNGSRAELRPVGAYALVLAAPGAMLGARDPNGIRPLVLGRLHQGGGHALASETSAFDLVGADYLGEVPAGQIVAVASGGWVKHHRLNQAARPTPCIFELVYFARPDSIVFGRSVYLTRKKMGALLAEECADLAGDLDMAMPFPDSGNYAGLGYCYGCRQAGFSLPGSGVRLEMAMIRNHYVGRTFIQPTQEMREYSVRIKLNPVAEILKDQRVAIVEDSIVRGTTSRGRADILRKLGPISLTMLVASPPVTRPCPYGVARGKLAAQGLEAAEIETRLAEFMGFDRLRFLSRESLIKAAEFKEDEVCWACFGGAYPIPPDDSFNNNAGEGPIAKPAAPEC